MKYKNYILVNKERSITNDEEYKFTLRNPITNQNSTVYVKYYLYHHVYFVKEKEDVNYIIKNFKELLQDWFWGD
jgi:hypothetical protein|nr:MAG TPA: hypothetical protein [Caudoviricetes sp.]